MNKNNGFTLSEVAIVIAVLAVLASIIIPTVTKISPSSNKVMFKKSCLTLEKSIAGMINDDTNYPGDAFVSGLTIPRGFNNTLPVTPGSVNKFCYYLAEQMNTVGAVTCPGRTTGPVTIFNSGFTLSDGSLWRFYIPVADSANDSETSSSAVTSSVQFPLSPTLYTTKVIVDVNGTKDPNCTNDSSFATYSLSKCATGVKADIFVFSIRYDGKIRIGSSVGSDTNAENMLKDSSVVN